MERFDGIAQRAMLGADRDDGGPGYTYRHCIRVMKIARSLASSEELRGRDVDEEAMSVAAMFHDVGRVIDSQNHCRAGYDFVMKEIAGLLDPVRLEKVAQIVLHHNKPVDVESEIIHDADLIDHCGAVGAGRMFYAFARRGEGLDRVADYYEECRNGWLAKYAEWAVFDTARAEIKRRIDVQDALMREFGRELKGVIATDNE